MENFDEFVFENVKSWRIIIEDWVSVGDVHIVNFENILDNRIEEITKILQFLDIDIEPWRLSCVQYCQFDMYLRKNNTQKKDSSLFSEKAKELVSKNIIEINSWLANMNIESLPLQKYTHILYTVF